MKKIFILSLSAIFLLSLAAPAFAGDKQRHRWQGVAIGMGAAILGHTILERSRNQPPPQHVVVERYPCRESYSPPQSYCPPPRQARGYWETRRVWVEPQCERVWNPAHYNRYGEWVPGDWIMVQEEPGYWVEERIWVARR